MELIKILNMTTVTKADRIDLANTRDPVNEELEL